MNNYFKTEYEKREELGRLALKELEQEHNIFKNPLLFCPDQYGAYDAYYFKIDNSTQSITKRVWIEIKIRDRIFPNYILEKKKWNRLEQKRKDLGLNKDEVTYLYLNFTPNSTYMWNITDFDKFIIEKMAMNKATSESRTDKIDKDITLLEPKSAYTIDYIYNEHNIMKKYEDEILLKKCKQAIIKKGLESVLF